MPSDPQTNPYESPSAEGAEFDDLHSKGWGSPFRQRIQLAWEWIILGVIAVVFASLMSQPLEFSLIQLLVGIGWLIAGFGSFFRAQPWVTRGVIVNYLAMVCLVSAGIPLLLVADAPAMVEFIILQGLNIVPILLTLQAFRVLEASR